MIRRTMAWKLLGEVPLLVHVAAPAADEWAELIAECRRAGTGLQHALVLVETVSLTAVQRREIADVVKQAGTRSAGVVSDAAITRALTTGLGWITGRHQAFSTKRLSDALDRAELRGAARRAAVNEALSMTNALGANELSQRLRRAWLDESARGLAADA
jgi:hypothetical protein